MKKSNAGMGYRFRLAKTLEVLMEAKGELKREMKQGSMKLPAVTRLAIRDSSEAEVEKNSEKVRNLGNDLFLGFWKRKRRVRLARQRISIYEKSLSSSSI